MSEIAHEKGGIIKKNVPVVISELQEETYPVFQAIARNKKAEIIHAYDIQCPYELDLLGNYQEKNARAVLGVVQLLLEKGVEISEEALSNGLKSVAKNTGLLGRYQVFQESPKVICDTAHNIEGLSVVLPQLLQEEYEELYIIIGVVDDKEVAGIAELFPIDATYAFVQPEIGRALDKEKLKTVFEEKGRKGEVFESILVAFEHLKNKISSSDLIYVGGSTFVVGDFLKYCKQ